MPKGLEILAKAKYGRDEYGCALAHGHANALSLPTIILGIVCTSTHSLTFLSTRLHHDTAITIYLAAPNTQARLNKSIMAQEISANQRNSRLLRLPAELRNQIYRYALGGRRVLLATTQPRLYPEEPIPNFALLRVCSQIHAEAALLLYSLNIFYFSTDASRTNAFLSSISTSKLGALEILVIHIKDVCENPDHTSPHLIQCKSLKEIRIRYTTNSLLSRNSDLSRVGCFAKLLRETIPDVKITTWNGDMGNKCTGHY